MKIGDYVRTEYGISKIIGIFPERTMVFIETDNGLGNCNSSQNGKLRKGIVVLEEDYRKFIDNNVKQEIIDLIEEGDYINGKEVFTLIDNQEPKLVATEDGCLNNNDIKTIITKEQLSSIEYRIGE